MNVEAQTTSLLYFQFLRIQYHQCKTYLKVPLVLCFAESMKELTFYQN